MAKSHFVVVLFAFQLLAFSGTAQPYFHATASISGNNILYKIKAVGGNITTGWSDIEFFFRNSTAALDADGEFAGATITINTTDFPGINIPYNGKNVQGTETGYNTYWFGLSFTSTSPKTYNQNQEYLVCTIGLTVSPSNFDLELCHNEPNFWPHYVVLTDEIGNDLTNLTGTNKFYGPDTVICNPNCPVSTPGNNHILPLNGAQPVELVDFQARKYQLTSARLDWRTALEINFKVFEIERQHPDGYWEHIGSEPGKAAPGEGATYMFYDHNPPGPTAYYRLKMLDADGSFAYSPLRSVTFEGDHTLRIFPNPASDVLHIAFGAGMYEDDLQIELVSRRGKVVAQTQIAVTPGAVENLAIGTYRLAAGTYLFRARSASGFLFQQYVTIQPGQ